MDGGSLDQYGALPEVVIRPVAVSMIEGKVCEIEINSGIVKHRLILMNHDCLFSFQPSALLRPPLLVEQLENHASRREAFQRSRQHERRNQTV